MDDQEEGVATEQKFRKQEWPYYWITRTSARYFMAMEKRLKPIGLDVPRYRVLMSLYEDDYLSVSEIADFCIIKLNTATKIIQRMVADDLVTTRQRPTDARVTEVTLTPRGDAQRQRARAIAAMIYQHSFPDLSPEDEQQMSELLARVFNRLGEL